MSGTARISVKAREKEAIQPFEDVLRRPNFTPEDVTRLRGYTIHERLWRARYHYRRYLSHVSENDLHLRIGYLLANVTYISGRSSREDR